MQDEPQIERAATVEAPPPADVGVEALLQERNRLWDDAHRARALEREVAHLRDHVERMEHSLSWRITAPLRAAKQAVGRVRQLARLARSARGRLRPPTG